MHSIDIFPWNENFNTGVAIIDEQHQKLVKILNRLALQVAQTADEKLLEELFKELSEYTIYHFSTEEKYWNEYLQDGSTEAEHQAIHKKFILKIEELQQEQKTKPLIDVVEDALEFLVNWLASHILETDREMAYTVAALKDGLSIQESKKIARDKMNDSSHIFIEIILSVYSTLSKNTLKLIKELKLHKKFDESQESLRLAASVFAHSREGILITSKENKIIEANQAVTDITGYTKEELLGKNPKILSSGKNPPSFYDNMWQNISKKDYWSGEIWNRHKSGKFYAEMLTISTIRDKQDNVLNYIALFADITSLKEHEGRLEYIAHYDALTGLPNRVLLSDRLKQAISQIHRRKTSLAIVYLDLDGFKEVNDMYGHDYGDELLSVLSQKMQSTLRSEDTIARIGGDEFVAVLVELKSHEESLVLLERLLKSVSEITHVKDREVKISASLGVAFFDAGDKTDPDQLLRQADQAMYQAKLAGKNRYHIFDPVEDRSIRTHHKKINAIESALLNKEFTLYYQPKINMKQGKVLGFEALIRWNHPQEGILSPALFLPTIEEHNMSIKIGEWVLEEACKQILRFQEQNLQLSINVNINAIHLLKGNFIENLTKTLQKYPSIQKGDLVVEILETSTIEDLGKVSQIIKEGEKLGVGFSLDDFGTGYSSLTYLKKLAVKQIKIDQSFIRDMLIDSDDLAIIESLIALSNAFHREIVAEGVESIEHGEMLLQLGCEVAQGYAIAKPMPAEAIEKWLQDYKPNKRWQETNPIAREKVIYLHAMAEHTAWIKNLLLAVEKNDFSTFAISPLECHFGIWLRNHPVDSHLALEKLNLTHNEVHFIASRLQAEKEYKECKACIEELKNKSKELMEQLKALILA